MKLEQSFEVDAPVDRVWEALVDVERVAPCLPGAAVTGRNDDGSYNGTFTIKIGPTTASYSGKLEMQNVDEREHKATMHAQGSDKRGQGGATATIVSTLRAEDHTTHVDVMTDYHITGRLARFGRGGMIEDISERLLREFAARLQSFLSRGGGVGVDAEQAGGATGAAVTADDDEQPTQEQPRVVAEPPETSPAPTEGVAPATAQAPAPPEPPPSPVAPPAPSVAPPASSAPPPPPAEPAPPKPEVARPPEPAPERAEPRAAQPPPASEAAPEPEPVNALALAGSVLLNRVRKNPKPLLAIAGGALVLGLLWHRR